MNLRLVIWVTSDCNLECKWCSQAHARKLSKGYHMSLEEISSIVESAKSRNLRFDVIELTGGEPTVWHHLDRGIKAFKTIADVVTLITNGNEPNKVKALNLNHWYVSNSQATKEQLAQYKNVNVLNINHKHKKPPLIPYKDSLPAKCCVQYDRFGVEQNSLTYYMGDVYYCCYAVALSKFVPVDKVAFQDDFIKEFSDKAYDKEMCTYCIGNRKIWKQL